MGMLVCRHTLKKGASSKEQVMEAVRGHFRPEFVNRVDDFVLFEPLGKPAIEQIVQLQVCCHTITAMQTLAFIWEI